MMNGIGRHRYSPFGLSALFILLLSCLNCAKEKDDLKTERNDYFSVAFASTKVGLDKDLHFCWDADDRVSVFCGNTGNSEYRFIGQDGDDSGILSVVSDCHTSVSLPANYAVYPYRQNTSLSSDGFLSIELPSVQKYKENSFDSNSSYFYAASQNTQDRKFVFQSLCGFLKVKIYGGVIVKSLSICGNNSEKLAGAALCSINEKDAIPQMKFTSTSSEYITLDCGEGVLTGMYPGMETVFWFVLPPVQFEKGFTIQITDIEGRSCQCVSNIERTINSNEIYTMKLMSEGISSFPFIRVDDDIHMPSEGGRKELFILSNVDVQSSIIESDWLKRVNGDSFVFEAEPNTTFFDREGLLHLYNDEYEISKDVFIRQNSSASKLIITVKGNSYTIPKLYGSNVKGVVNWGEGEEYDSYSDSQTHTYQSEEIEHTVTISAKGCSNVEFQDIKDGMSIDLSKF